MVIQEKLIVLRKVYARVIRSEGSLPMPTTYFEMTQKKIEQERQTV